MSGFGRTYRNGTRIILSKWTLQYFRVNIISKDVSPRVTRRTEMAFEHFYAFRIYKNRNFRVNIHNSNAKVMRTRWKIVLSKHVGSRWKYSQIRRPRKRKNKQKNVFLSIFHVKNTFPNVADQTEVKFAVRYVKSYRYYYVHLRDDISSVQIRRSQIEHDTETGCFLNVIFGFRYFIPRQC